MDEQFILFRDLTTQSSAELTTPRLLLSSDTSGWEGVTARAYLEPEQFEGMVLPDPERNVLSLILFLGGSMYVERSFQGRWHGLLLNTQDLSLSPRGDQPGELRWQVRTPGPMHTLRLHLSNDLLARTAEEVAEFDSARLSLRERPRFQDPLLFQVGLNLLHELCEQAPAGKIYAQTAAHLLALHLLRHYSSASAAIQKSKQPEQGLTRQQLARVIDFVQAHLARDISLESLAQQAGFSPYHFARLFRQSVGESPHQFVLRQRVEQAQRLLKETEQPLAQIALESGFANQSHLNRVFKRQLGLTPRSYRRS